MTYEQEQSISRARQKIGEIRTILDGVMYYSGVLPEKEFKRIREGYDLICKANDKLP